MKFACGPTNVNQLIQYAKKIRMLFDCPSNVAFPIVKILETLSYKEEEDEFHVNLEIVSDESKIFTSEFELGKYDYTSNTIYIAEGQYDAACQDEPKSRFTLTHELAHFFLMHVTGRIPVVVEDDSMIIPSFRDPEWQANRLAGLILVPPDEIESMTVEEIQNKYIVSDICAEYSLLLRLKKIHKEENK